MDNEEITGVFVAYADVPDEFKPLKNVYCVYPGGRDERMPCDFFAIEHLKRNGKTHGYDVYYCKNDGTVFECWLRSSMETAKKCAEEDVGHQLTWHKCNFELPEEYVDLESMYDTVPRKLFP